MTLHVIFQVGDGEYALPASDVVQLESWSGATRVPGAAPWVVGLVHLRGAAVPVVDLRARFGLPPREPTVDERIVVIRRGDKAVGLKVDRAREVVSLGEDAFEPPPDLVRVTSGRWVRAVARVGDRLLMDVDFDRVVDGSIG